jgi:isoquinoline 1-oxidoreductase alpha subunit
MAILRVNGVEHEVDVEPQMPLLWVLREEIGLRGTKFGCGKGLCGACTVHLDGRAVRSCILPVGSVGDAAVTTIEGLGTPEAPHPVQRQWLTHRVPQCGYCQSGMQMAAAAFLDARTVPEGEAGAPATPVTDAEVCAAITNICRCGCYERIRRAVVDASGEAS